MRSVYKPAKKLRDMDQIGLIFVSVISRFDQNLIC